MLSDCAQIVSLRYMVQHDDDAVVYVVWLYNVKCYTEWAL